MDETPEKAAHEQIKAALVLSEAELARQEKLFRTGVAATQDLDRARSTRDQDKKRLDQTDWSFVQKKQSALQSGLVYDTLLRQGEWVPAGKPVVVLLPPQNIKVRAFVPETRVGSIHYGDTARVTVDGMKRSFLRESELHLAARGIHAAGHLQPREPSEARLHGRIGLRSAGRGQSASGSTGGRRI